MATALADYPILPLRAGVRLSEGPRTIGGAPSWTLQDPVTGRDFRLGWPEFEMLRRWALGSAPRIAAAIHDETVLSMTTLMQFPARRA